MMRAERCSCGRVPVIRARETREGTVITQVTCARVACGAQGLAIEDFERNDAVAIEQWNRHGGRKVA
ncbi:hypothetical protein SAMN02927924_01349 [Sphingobium faniae]|nr:hypothetical protein SAMN02927924_01349 [Sphingobium faniae]